MAGGGAPDVDHDVGQTESAVSVPELGRAVVVAEVIAGDVALAAGVGAVDDVALAARDGIGVLDGAADAERAVHLPAVRTVLIGTELADFEGLIEVSSREDLIVDIRACAAVGLQLEVAALDVGGLVEVAAVGHKDGLDVRHVNALDLAVRAGIERGGVTADGADHLGEAEARLGEGLDRVNLGLVDLITPAVLSLVERFKLIDVVNGQLVLGLGQGNAVDRDLAGGEERFHARLGVAVEILVEELVGQLGRAVVGVDIRHALLGGDDGGVVDRIIIHGEADRLAEVAELEVVVAAEVIRLGVDSLAVHGQLPCALDAGRGLVLADGELAADSGVSLAGGDLDDALIAVHGDLELIVRAAQQRGEVAQLEVVVAVDVVLFAGAVRAVDVERLGGDDCLRAGVRRESAGHHAERHHERQRDAQQFFASVFQGYFLSFIKITKHVRFWCVPSESSRFPRLLGMYIIQETAKFSIRICATFPFSALLTDFSRQFWHCVQIVAHLCHK